MKAILTLCIAAALTTFAHAQDKPGLDINKSPWSGSTTDRNDGLSGSSTTTIRRDIGDGLSIGGQVKTPYQDPALGGSGPPANPIDGARSGGTTFGPVLEKKF